MPTPARFPDGVERRAGVELRAAPGRRLAGYAATFNSAAIIGSTFTETTELLTHERMRQSTTGSQSIARETDRPITGSSPDAGREGHAPAPSDTMLALTLSALFMQEAGAQNGYHVIGQGSASCGSWTADPRSP